MKFKLYFEEMENNKYATVYHRTDSKSLNSIIVSKKLKRGAGQFGEGVYCFLELKPALIASHYASFIVAAKINLYGFVPMSGISEDIKMNIYGTPYTGEIRNILYKDNKIPEGVNKLAFELEEVRKYMPNCPGIIMPARPNNQYHWVIVYNDSLLRPYAFTEATENSKSIKWQKI